MEEGILHDIEVNQVDSQLVSKLNEVLKPILDKKNVDSVLATRLCNFILRLLKLGRDRLDSSEFNDHLIEMILLCCRGLQSISYGFYDDQIVIGKVIHFIVISMIKHQQKLLASMLDVCRYLFEFLVLMDANGNLSQFEKKSPVARNSWTYLWNLFIARQKDSVRSGDDYSILSYALRFYLLVEPSLVFDKYYAVIQRDLNSTETENDVTDRVHNMSIDVIQALLEKLKLKDDERVMVSLCKIATLSSCFALNKNNLVNFEHIINAVKQYCSKDSCLNLLNMWLTNSILELNCLMENSIQDGALLCLSETFNSLLIKAPENLEVESVLLLYCEREFKSLNESNCADVKSRRLVLLSRMCTVYQTRIQRLFDDALEYQSVAEEVSKLESLLLDAMTWNSRSYFPKKMHELAFVIIRKAQCLKKSGHTSEAIMFYEKGLSMVEIWADKTNRPREDLWSLYQEISSLYFTNAEYEKILDLMETVVVKNCKNLQDIAAIYTRCKKAGDLETSGRYLSDKLSENVDRYSEVLKNEYCAWKKYKVIQVRDSLLNIIEKLLAVVTEPIDHGYWLLERAIVFWSLAEFDQALEVVNESLAIIEESAGRNQMALARAYLWKYVIQKSTMSCVFKIDQTAEETCYNKNVNDFNEKQESERTSLKFDDCFTLYQEHELSRLLLKSLACMEELKPDGFPSEFEAEIEMLHGIFMLNGSVEQALKTSELLETDVMKLARVECYMEMAEYEKAVETLDSCVDQKCVAWRIMKSRVLLCKGDVAEGYDTAEALNDERSELSTRQLGRLTSLMVDYHILPLQEIGVSVKLDNENSYPLLMSTLSYQCSQQTFIKTTGLEPDKLGILPEVPDCTNLTLSNLMTQYSALNEYLNVMLNSSRRHYEVGEAKHGRTYLLDAITLALRFCLPKWTSRILIESARLGLMEGRIQQSLEKLRRAHSVLNKDFMVLSEATETIVDDGEDVFTKDSSVQDGIEVKAMNLINEFGFDLDADDVIHSQCLKTSRTLVKQEAHSLIGCEKSLLVPANHKESCKICVSDCTFSQDVSLALLSMNILVLQSECFLSGGAIDGIELADSSIRDLFHDYQQVYNDSLFHDLLMKQQLTLAKSMSNFSTFKDIIDSYQFMNNPQLIRYFLLLTEAYYLLGIENLDSNRLKSTMMKQEIHPIKKTLLDQLCNDDENDEYQVEMQKEAKEMKDLNEEPIKENGGRRRKANKKAEVTKKDIVVEPSTTNEDDGMITPEGRVNTVAATGKISETVLSRRGRKVNTDKTAPAVKRKVTKPKLSAKETMGDCTPVVVDDSPCCKESPSSPVRAKVPDAPKRGRRPENTQNEKSIRVLDLKRPSTTEDHIPIFNDNDADSSPSSVNSEDLDQLLSSMAINDSPPETADKKTKTKANAAKKNSKTSAPRTSRSRKNAVVEETPKPTCTRSTRGRKKNPIETLRGTDEIDPRVQDDRLIGEFRDEKSSVQNDVFDVEGYYPRVEVLRGPASRNSTNRRKALADVSSSENIPTKTKPTSRKKSQSKSTKMADTCGRKYLLEAFRLLRHHPVTSLYRDVCKALGVLTYEEDPWLAAYYFNEACCVSYRHEAILSVLKKRAQRRLMKLVNEAEDVDVKVEECVCFPKNLEHFRSMLSELPTDWTIVIISIVTSPFQPINRLFITRLSADLETSVIVECPGFAAVGEKVLENFEETICDARMRNSNCEDRVRWWTAKRMYSDTVQNLIDQLEDDVLSYQKCLLMGAYENSDIVDNATEKATGLLSRYKPDSPDKDLDILVVLLQSLFYLNGCQIELAISDIFNSCCDKERKDILSELMDFKTQFPMTGQRRPVILIVDKYISQLPFENMRVLAQNPVIRSLSVYTLYCQYLVNTVLKHQKLSITGPDMENISYILDPEFNLPATREQFADWFSQLGWRGLVGQKPSREVMEKHLTQSDMMLYLGHGSGQRYVDGYRIQKLCCRAAVILMGCSSGALKANGQLDASGMIVNYLLARSPFVMGNLWDVTDGDIDRFTKALLEFWLSAEPGTKLHTAMQHAREACRLRYLTGSAPVMYGLPI